MAEVNAARGSNGYRGASLFAGGGGSSTGWALAGFKVIWANEFMDHAAATYRANHPETILDQRSIRDVKPEEILKATGLGGGELDFLDGSPPCDSFSTAGKRTKGWGKEKAYYGGKKRQRTDDLFFEYVRILDGLRPRMFIAENVTGLIKGAAKGRFLQILRALKATGYHVEVRVLDAQWLGVPQCRARVIFQGRREGERLRWPKPHRKRISLAEAIGSGIGRGDPLPPSRAKAYAGADAFNFERLCADAPAPTVTVSSPGNDLGHPDAARKLTIPELKAISSFPADYDLKGSYAQQWAVCGMSVPPLMMFEIAKSVRKSLDAWEAEV
ncbi:MAG: DNA cytosine methyltransferase [bacterium]|nr:DNA cytosine methyltransferase [bacterium]